MTFDLKRTLLIAGFPGVGKSHMIEHSTAVISDSDSSSFSKSTDFPDNYIEHIKSNCGKFDIIMISTHKEVRDALVKEGMKFTLVYPDRNQLYEYVQRFIQRGDNDKFLGFITKNWESFIEDLHGQRGCVHVILEAGEYLSDKLRLFM